MIGLLEGIRIETWQIGAKKGVLISCGGVGYEVQTTSRHISQLETQNKLMLWIHHIQRDDIQNLFGFPSKVERDLFRVLVAVNGVGPQLALSLLETMQAEELIEALENSELKRLSSAPGVGKRTAERLIIELRTKLTHFQSIEKKQHLSESSKTFPTPETADSKTFEEIHLALSSLGYEDLEIRKALKAVVLNQANTVRSKGCQEFRDDDTDYFLRESLRWLSQEAA